MLNLSAYNMIPFIQYVTLDHLPLRIGQLRSAFAIDKSIFDYLNVCITKCYLYLLIDYQIPVHWYNTGKHRYIIHSSQFRRLIFVISISICYQSHLGQATSTA